MTKNYSKNNTNMNIELKESMNNPTLYTKQNKK